jgi:alkylation response protein AidB-like acyl-CoA dehydrogenase
MTELAGADFADSVRRDAAERDRQGTVPADVIQAMAKAGFLAADLPGQYGCPAQSQAGLGELRACPSGVRSALRSLVTVQGMMAAAVLRWDTGDQRVVEVGHGNGLGASSLQVGQARLML